MPWLSPVALFPYLGDPSELSLAPQPPSLWPPYSFNPAPDRPADPPRLRSGETVWRQVTADRYGVFTP